MPRFPLIGSDLLYFLCISTEETVEMYTHLATEPENTKTVYFSHVCTAVPAPVLVIMVALEPS